MAWSGARARSLTLMLGEEERRRRFGYALQEALRARKLSERQLAMRLQVDPRKVAAWRSGRTLPSSLRSPAIVSTAATRRGSVMAVIRSFLGFAGGLAWQAKVLEQAFDG